MSSLHVNNRVLRYRGISYQISQIASKSVVHIERLKDIKYTSLQPLKFLLPATAVCGLLGYELAGRDVEAGVYLLVAAVIMGLIVALLLKFRFDQFRMEKYQKLYGLYLHMSNGDKPIFISSSLAAIEDVDDAVDRAMNSSEGVSVKFDNVNIDISDSENVNIGSVVS